MKNRLKLITLGAFFFCTLSCSTDNNEITKVIEPSNVTNNTIKKPASNINNPFENIGELHNQFLTQMHTANVTSEDVINNSALSFANSNGYDTSMISTADVKNIVDQALTMEPTTDNLNVLAATYNFSDSYKTELNKLFLFLSYQSYISIDEIQNSLVNIEVEYMNAPVTATEKENLLRLIVIARYSTEYWINRLPSGAYTMDKGKLFNRLLGVIGCDILGAAVGAFVLGAVSGGTLAPLGAHLGASAGSAAAQVEISKNGL